jgi:hypothetical protein
MLFDVVTDELC